MPSAVFSTPSDAVAMESSEMRCGRFFVKSTSKSSERSCVLKSKNSLWPCNTSKSKRSVLKPTTRSARFNSSMSSFTSRSP